MVHYPGFLVIVIWIRVIMLPKGTYNNVSEENICFLKRNYSTQLMDSCLNTVFLVRTDLTLKVNLE